MRLLPSATRRFARRGAAAVLLAAAIAPVQASPQKKPTAPEVFNGRATIASAAGRGDAYVTIRVDRYSAPKDVKSMEQALRDGGSTAFVHALRQAPVVGRFEVGTQTFAIRWARQRDAGGKRMISLVTDAPVYFVGGGVPDAKSREGFDVAVIQLLLDPSGLGDGTMAAAARVKPGEAGVDVEAYEGDPVKLLSIMRKVT
jgi:hypothetical protein